jgi:hypothetical protein
MLTRILFKHVFFLLLCSYHLSGFARSEADDVIARVNGETISRSLYQRFRGYLENDLRRRFTGNELNRELATQQRGVLRTLIEEQLLRQRVAKLGISPETEVIKYLDEVRRNSGFDDLESLEQSFVANGVDPRKLKYDIEQQLLRDRLLREDVNRRSNRSLQAIDPVSRQTGTSKPPLELQQKKGAVLSQGSLYDYIKD